MNKGFKTKSNKGITLVALIITIVVLLILAGVAIGTVRDSDIIGYAKNAAGGYNEAKQNELDQIAGYEDLLSKYGNSSSNFDWSSVNLGDVDLNAYYEFKGDAVYRLTFKPNGTIEVTRDGVLEVIDVKAGEKTENGVKVNYKAMNTDVILTMVDKNIKANLLDIDGGMTITYERYKMMEVYSNSEEAALDGSYYILTKDSWYFVLQGTVTDLKTAGEEVTIIEGTIDTLKETIGRNSLTISGWDYVEDKSYVWLIDTRDSGICVAYFMDKSSDTNCLANFRDLGGDEISVEVMNNKYVVAVPDSMLTQIGL